MSFSDEWSVTYITRMPVSKFMKQRGTGRYIFILRDYSNYIENLPKKRKHSVKRASLANSNC